MFHRLLNVCVCVCVCACVRVCVFIVFTVKAFSACSDVCHIPECMDQQSCVVSINLGASANFLHLRF